MAADPPTLAEFEREARIAAIEAASIGYDSYGPVVDFNGAAFDRWMRPLILHLLAVERERCAQEADALGERTTAHAIRNMENPT